MNHWQGSRLGTGATLPEIDFPDRFSPIFVRELRRCVRMPFFEWGFVVLQTSAVLAGIAEWGAPHGILPNALPILVATTFGLLTPLALFGALRTELERGRNIELLHVASLNPAQIVLGRLLVAACLNGILLLSLLPHLLARYLLGRAELSDLAAFALWIALQNTVMNAIVLGASGLVGFVSRVLVIGFLGVVHLAMVMPYTATFVSRHAGSPILGSVGVLLGTVLSWTFGFWLATSNLDADPSTACGRPPIYILGFLFLFAHTTVASGAGLGSGAFILLLFILVVVLIGLLPKNRSLPAKTS